MDERVGKAFDFAQEVTKQLITLATGVVALTITFLHDIVGTGRAGEGLLKAAWILYTLSVTAGVATLMMLAGNLGPPEGTPPTNPTIYATNIRVASYAQIALFLAGLVLTIAFGFKVTRSF